MSSWDELIGTTLTDLAGDKAQADAEQATKAGKQAQAERGLTKKQRKEKVRQAARVRVFFDVPDWLRDAVMQAAEAEGTSASSLAAALLDAGLRELSAGRLDLQKRPSDSPRFEWIVEVDEPKESFMRVFGR